MEPQLQHIDSSAACRIAHEKLAQESAKWNMGSGAVGKEGDDLFTISKVALRRTPRTTESAS